jgi:hypothetical protein
MVMGALARVHAQAPPEDGVCTRAKAPITVHGKPSGRISKHTVLLYYNVSH